MSSSDDELPPEAVPLSVAQLDGTPKGAEEFEDGAGQQTAAQVRCSAADDRRRVLPPPACAAPGPSPTCRPLFRHAVSGGSICCSSSASTTRSRAYYADHWLPGCWQNDAGGCTGCTRRCLALPAFDLSCGPCPAI